MDFIIHDHGVQVKKASILALTFRHTGKGSALPLCTKGGGANIIMNLSHKVNGELIQFKMKCNQNRPH